MWADNGPRTKEHLTKNPTNNHEKSSFELLVRVVQEIPQTLQTMDISLGRPPARGTR